VLDESNSCKKIEKTNFKSKSSIH